MAEGLRCVVIPYWYTTTPCSRLVKPMSINKEVCARDPSTQDDVMNHLVVLEYRNSIRQTYPSNLIVPEVASLPNSFKSTDAMGHSLVYETGL